MSHRPYFRYKANDLEAEFLANQDSLEKLVILRDELAYRSTGKSKHLQDQVESQIEQLQKPSISISLNVETSVTFKTTVTETSIIETPSQEDEVLPEIPQRTAPIASEKVNPVDEEAARMSSILEYWRAVEMFNPQQAPKIEPGAAEPVYSVYHGELFPWEEGHTHRRRRPPENCLWRYIVYVGIFPLQHISTVLEQAFGRDPEALDERLDGSAAVFCLSLTHRAQLLIESFVLSSSAWALSRLKNPGPKVNEWLEGFESTESHLIEYLSTVFSDRTEKSTSNSNTSSLPPLGRTITNEELFQLLQRILTYLSLDSPDFEHRLVVRCVPVSFKKYKNTDDVDALNSFFIRDLSKVSKAVTLGKCSQPLASYLGKKDLNLATRVDVRKQEPLTFCWEKLKPSRFSPAKWPSPGHHPLVYSQQVAVNELLEESSNQALFGINGPPGTGKTTLLRDIIAALVTKRAQALAELPNPKVGFKGNYNWKTGTMQRRINVLIESLRGFEMVVTSANNGAVENVTLELPTANSVDSSWGNEAIYFKEFASQLVGSEAWGLIAARLGNKANRRDFLSRFWFGVEVETDSEDEVSDSNKINQTLRNGFQTYLKEKEITQVNWASAVTVFKKALNEEAIIRQAREVTWSEVPKENRLQNEKRLLDEKLTDLKSRLKAIEEKYNKAFANSEECSGRLQQARDERLNHQAFKPSLGIMIFTLGKAYREWREPDLVYQTKISEAEKYYNNAKLELQSLDEEQKKLHSEQNQHENLIIENEKELIKTQKNIESAKEKLNSHFPYTSEWFQNESARELSSPWMDREWSLARAKVFLAALRLHQEFIHANAKEFRQNLDALSDVLSGNLPANASTESVRAAWDSLFLIIPVISTTFASFDRLFPFHDKESIGWLFIDEAGQATPQAAAGALWRARHAVVVGDPLQLEPILPLPFTAQDSLRHHFSVNSNWRPGELSCQRLADQASKLGTWVTTDDDPLWIGAPLRVHRRCDNPMFNISNRVAYDDLMIYGTAKRSEMGCRISSWFDNNSQQADSHWIPEEGELTQNLLNELFSAGITPKEVFLISPFRSVVKELYRIAKKHEGVRAGTIHTVQGKEADVVVLVLGGNPNKPGAKDWAAKKPNLVNVAVSRAKRRIYVIGNHQEWSKRRYFSTMAKHLHHYKNV